MRRCILVTLFNFLLSSAAFGAASVVELTNITTETKGKHTRIVFELDRKPEFNIIPDPARKRVLLNIPNVKVPFHIDRNLEDRLMTTFVSVSEKNNEMNAFVSLKKDPFSFHYFLLSDPYRIVLDLIERDAKKVKNLQAYREGSKEGATPGPLKKVLMREDQRAEGRKKSDQYEKKEFVSPSIEEEKKIYFAGLRSFGREEFEETIKAMESLQATYPGSRFLGNSLYIVAESYFGLMKSPPKLEEGETAKDYVPLAMNAYRIAFSKDPENHRRESALFRTASVYLDQGKNLEAGSMFQMLVDEYPKGQFAPRSLLGRAKIFSSEKRFDEAYNELEKVLFLYPFSPVIRGATFNIADSYYLEKDYKRAVNIYDQAAKKWPSYPKNNPDTLFFMGEAYFHSGNLKEAEKRLFQLVNLYPAWTFTPQALEKIGDIYRENRKYPESMKIYSFVVKHYPDEPVRNSSLVHLADLGREQQIPTYSGMIFDHYAYENPQKVYSEILENSPTQDLRRDSLFGSGKTYKKRMQYLEAIDRFQELIGEYSEEELAQKSKDELREIFFDLMAKYHAQEGFFQVLLTYYKNFEQFFSELKEPGLLYEVGDSYRFFGVYDKALEMFTSAARFDKGGKHREAILLGTSEALLGMNRIKDAEKGLKKLLKAYRNGKYSKSARMLLGEVLISQKRYGESISILSQFVKKYAKGESRIKAFYLMGIAEEERKFFKNAVSHYRSAVKQIGEIPENEALNQKKASIQFKITRALFKGKEYRKVIEHAGILKKLYTKDMRMQWARYLEAESFRRLKDVESSKGILVSLAEVDDKVVRAVAAVEADYLTWKEEHPDLFVKKAKTRRKR